MSLSEEEDEALPPPQRRERQRQRALRKLAEAQAVAGPLLPRPAQVQATPGVVGVAPGFDPSPYQLYLQQQPQQMAQQQQPQQQQHTPAWQQQQQQQQQASSFQQPH